jgi:hypothetical protein
MQEWEIRADVFTTVHARLTCYTVFLAKNADDLADVACRAVEVTRALWPDAPRVDITRLTRVS